jgi:hypothetical protein
MEEKIDKAIETVLLQVRSNLKPDESLKATQAVLNIMHARALWNAMANQPEGKRPKTN